MADKLTNKEMTQGLNTLAKKAANTDLVLSLFIDFMGKNVDFKKYLIDWEEKQRIAKEEADKKKSNGIIMPPEKKIITP